MKKMKIEIVAAIIGGIFAIVAAIISAKLGEQRGAQAVMNEISSYITTVTGDNNYITINDINTFVTNYLELEERNQQLQQINTQYSALIEEKDRQIEEKENQIRENNGHVEELNNQLAGAPIITYQDRELYISAEKIPINTTSSMIVVDGREYLSREIVDYLLPDRENLTIKSDGIYVGPVINESANLFNQWIMSGYLGEADTCTDSYGNQYTNVYKLWNDDTVTYSINQQYSQLRISIAIGLGYGSDDGIITIKADDEIVYTSPFLTYKTEPFTEVSIPINNCKLLSIEHRGGYSGDYCIISEAIVYN